MLKSLLGLTISFGAFWGSPAMGQGLTAKEKGREPAAQPVQKAEESVKSFRVPEGFEVRLFAAEPDVVNPVAMTWDERGRLWVVELIDYPYTTAEGAKNRDRVKVLEDTDGDGRADKVTVFAEGLNLATGIAVGNGGVYIGAAPNLWFMKDTNGDDVADEKKIILTGFGVEDRHELLNGFSWGPDGWLHFTHGVFTNSNVKDPENPHRPAVKFNAGVLRFNPTDKRLELYADGISNQWGVDWDVAGNAFVSACVVEHLWHVVPGGIYVRQGGVPGWPYAYDLLKHINDHKHFRAAYSGIQVYQGGAYPDSYKGTIFMGNIHGNSINHDQLVPNGSSFIAKDLHKGTHHVDDAFLNTTDGWFRPVSTQTGPDGNLWIADWCDKYPCYQNARQPDLDRTHGRIWRVVYTGAEKGKAVPARPAGLDLLKKSDGELAAALKDSNVWIRRQAQRILTERKADVSKVLMAMLSDRSAGASIESRMAALWTLNGVGALDDGGLMALANDSDENVRAWTARIIGDRAGAGQLKGAAGPTLLLRLAADKSPVVRAGVAQAARQYAKVNGGKTGGPIVQALLLAPGTAEDTMLPQLIWYATEPLIAADAAPMLRWLGEHPEVVAASGPIAPRSIVRRLYGSGDAVQIAMALEFVAKVKDTPLGPICVDGIVAGHKSFMPAPAGGVEWANALAGAKDKGVADKAKQLATIWGSKSGVGAALAMAGNTKASEIDRAAAVKLLRGNKSEEVRKALLGILSEHRRETLKMEIFRVLADIGSDADASTVLMHWERYSTNDARRAAAEMLSGRGAWAKALLRAVQAKKVEGSDIPLPALRTLATLAAKDDELKTLMAATVGAYRESPADKKKIIEAKTAVVMNGAVDKKRGHALFLQHCGVCHSLNGEGSSVPVGPDITGVGRGTLDLLLNNVIDPDQIIGAGYENVIVDTNDGDTKSGRLVEETPQFIKLLAAGPKEEVIQKKDIKERRISAKSVMPEGFDQVLKDEEFRDLIRFVLEAPVKQ